MQYTLLKACLQSLWLQMQALLLQCFGQSTVVLTWGGAGRCQLSDQPCPVFQAIESAIGGNAYQHSKVNQWTTNVVEQTLSQLTKLGKPFKYIGNGFLLLKDCLVSGEQCGAETPNREAPGRSRALVYTATQLACVATGHVSGFPSIPGQMRLAQAGGICGCCRTRRSPRRMFVVNISHVRAKRDRKELCCQVDFSNKSLF